LSHEHGKLDDDLRTMSIGAPMVQLICDYCPFVMEDVGRLAPMPAELVESLQFWWQFVASMAWMLRILVPCGLTMKLKLC
jgi:hypothetical protein